MNSLARHAIRGAVASSGGGRKRRGERGRARRAYSGIVVRRSRPPTVRVAVRHPREADHRRQRAGATGDEPVEDVHESRAGEHYLTASSGSERSDGRIHSRTAKIESPGHRRGFRLRLPSATWVLSWYSSWSCPLPWLDSWPCLFRPCSPPSAHRLALRHRPALPERPGWLS